MAMILNIPQGFVTSSETLAAFEALRPELEVLAATSPASPTTSSAYAAASMLGAAENLAPLMPALAQHCPTADLAAIGRLKTLGNALLFTQAVIQHALQSDDVLETLAAQLVERRRKHSLELELAKARGATVDGRLNITNGNGYYEIAQDVRALVVHMLANFDVLSVGTGSTKEDLATSLELTDRFSSVHARAERERDRLAEPTAFRNAALKLGLAALREAERCVEYLRFYQEDAQTFVPTAYAGGRRRRAKPSSDEAADASVSAAAGASTSQSAVGAALNVPASIITPSLQDEG